MAIRSVSIITNGVQKQLEGMLVREKQLQGFLNRVTYRQYQNAQSKRWITENSSEGNRWKELSPIYAEYKKKRYGGGPRFTWVGGRGPNAPWMRTGNWPSYPGKGTKKMIATGDLVGSVIGPMEGSQIDLPQRTRGHRKLVTTNSIEIFSTIEYADEANEQRNFMTFSKKTEQEMVDSIMKFLVESQGGVG